MSNAEKSLIRIKELRARAQTISLGYASFSDFDFDVIMDLTNVIMESTDKLVVFAAIDALGDFKSFSMPALPLLFEMAKVQDQDIRLITLETMMKIDEGRCLSYLLPAVMGGGIEEQMFLMHNFEQIKLPIFPIIPFLKIGNINNQGEIRNHIFLKIVSQMLLVSGFSQMSTVIVCISNERAKGLHSQILPDYVASEKNKSPWENSSVGDDELIRTRKRVPRRLIHSRSEIRGNIGNYERIFLIRNDIKGYWVIEINGEKVANAISAYCLILGIKYISETNNQKKAFVKREFRKGRELIAAFFSFLDENQIGYEWLGRTLRIFDK